MTPGRRAIPTHLMPVAILLAMPVVVAVLFTGCSAAPTLPTAAYDVTLVVDGTSQAYETQARTVREFLDETDVQLGPMDRVSPPEITVVRDGLTVTIVRVSYSTLVMSQTIPFERQILRDATVPEGESRLLQSGRSGTLERRYRITYEDQEEVERVLVAEELLVEPEDEVRLVGTKPKLQNLEIEGTLAYLSKQDAWSIRDSSFQRRRLTHLGDLDGRVFTLSPDGRQLLFTQAVTESDHLNELWLVSTTQASPDPVPLSLEDVLWAGWASNGTTIAWTTAETTEQAPGWRGHNDLWTGRISDKDTLVSRRQVLEPEAGGGHGWWGTRYAWGPEGERLAFSRPESVGIVELDAREREVLIHFAALRTFSSWAWHPALSWSPSGSFIASVTHAPLEGDESPEESPVFNLISLETTGSYSATLAVEVGTWAAPTFSPDGTTLLFGRALIPFQSATSRYALYLIDIDGSNQRPLYLPDGDGGLELPAWVWSPSGDAVALIDDGDVQIFTLGEDAPVDLTDEGNVTLIDWR
ncbi:MAG: G5 domain-containing protein [Anaerolineae bacterium]